MDMITNPVRYTLPVWRYRDHKVSAWTKGEACVKLGRLQGLGTIPKRQHVRLVSRAKPIREPQGA